MGLYIQSFNVHILTTHKFSLKGKTTKQVNRQALSQSGNYECNFKCILTVMKSYPNFLRTRKIRFDIITWFHLMIQNKQKKRLEVGNTILIILHLNDISYTDSINYSKSPVNNLHCLYSIHCIINHVHQLELIDSVPCVAYYEVQTDSVEG